MGVEVAGGVMEEEPAARAFEAAAAPDAVADQPGPEPLGPIGVFILALAGLMLIGGLWMALAHRPTFYARYYDLTIFLLILALAALVVAAAGFVHLRVMIWLRQPAVVPGEAEAASPAGDDPPTAAGHTPPEGGSDTPFL